ncbi:MAG: hypothetical protein LBP52_02320 [Burkholderiaceae bacterium]|nr:hypothetical protein [Burkholderiaceae bacterium]
MSFDLYLEHFESGESAPVDRDKILAILLREHCQKDRYGFHLAEFSDGTHVSMTMPNLEDGEEGEDGGKDFTGCAFHLRGFSPMIINFIFSVAEAGDMVIFNFQGKNTVDDPVLIALNPQQLPHLPKLTTNGTEAYIPVLCTSPEQLWTLLGMGFEEWTDYRDQVIGRQP